MKNLKKLAGIMLALVMVLAMAVPVFATTDADTPTGKITITNAVDGQSYDIYKMFDLEYNTSTKAYLYKVTTDWNDFITTGYGKDYFKLKDGYVTVKDGVTIDNNSVIAAAIAKEALKYAGTKGIQPETTLPNEGATADKKYVAEGLPLGYYLVDSSLGTICALDTTNTDVEINEKNGVPTNEKKVEEDDETDETKKYGTENDAEIGQDMKFQSTITAQEGAENYVFHDKMTNMDFKQVDGITLNGTAVAAENYKVIPTETEAVTDDCTFEVVFTQAFCDTLKDNDKIVISYTAALNGGANIGATGNANESKVSYGQEGKTKFTTPSTTTSRTWEFNVFKYTTLNGAETPLSGAKFTISRNADGSNPISLVKVTGKATDTYRPAIGDETGSLTEIETNATGKFTIQGLDSDTYYLKETKAPAGYNYPANPITTVTINNEGKINATEQNAEGAANKEIKILNQTGSELPSTGGVGTMIFYIVGGVLLVGAGVLLVVRKRMSAEKKSK